MAGEGRATGRGCGGRLIAGGSCRLVGVGVLVSGVRVLAGSSRRNDGHRGIEAQKGVRIWHGVGESVLLLGLGEGAAPRLLKELTPDVLEGLGEGAESAGRRSFADVLAGLRGTDTGGRGEADPEEPKEPEAQLR